ncbi:class I SAM-dependent methyltransferase [Clostridium sp. FP2]|uniref:class I SAM-dependent methyltransferase n=1 Tax=Clostridium sp. FP2 TaxID=2724481 RepID=UPI0013E93E43|nr:class I SAM-dependent methyltransferase [Clostridium sp. FP2]MBZ9624562.1 class I SAM-dependent methyltransferase [Clostridium sp. FP2]
MGNIKVSKRDSCRICKGNMLIPWLRLKDMPLTDDLRKSKKEDEFLNDIVIYYCSECGTSQTLHDISYDNYYDNYSYTVSSSEFANDFMKKLATKVFDEYNLSKDSRVIEIGSGDGKQLLCFKELGADVFGFEPSSELCEVSMRIGVPVYPGLFNEDSLEDVPDRFRQADVIILTYTFDHIPEPANFLDNAMKLIDKENGLLIIEVHDLEKILERKEYCLFEHEHTIYMSRESLTRTLEKAGFEVIPKDLLDESECRGNSLLIIAKVKGDSVDESKLSKKFQGDIEIYNDFEKKLKISINNIDNFIIHNHTLGKKIAGFGAGGRGVMTLAAISSFQKIDYVCDNNKSMQGLITPKTHIPVVDPIHIKDNPIDIVIAFSYGYIDEIKKQVKSITSREIQVISLLDLL